VTAETAGQAAYEAFRSAVPDWVCNVPAGPWDELSPAIRAGFDAIAAQEPHAAPECDDSGDDCPAHGEPHAAPGVTSPHGAAGTPLSDYLRERGRPGVADMIEDAERDLDAAREPHAAPGPAGCECGHAQTGHAFSDDVCAVPDCPCPGYRSTPRAAPELAVVVAERDDYAARLRAADQSWTRIAVERDALRERAEAAEAAKRQAKGDLAGLEDRLAKVIAAALMAERARIRELADRTGAVCTGDEGTSHYFSALLTEAPDA
jgi:hypothetical protein